MKGLRDLQDRLAAGEIVALTARAWGRLAPAFTLVETHDTGLAGVLALVELDGRLAAVEQPDRKTRAVRPLASRKAAREFVKTRLAAYDRLWDG
ncbi:hypothetical protein KKG45_10615 [bacterium]|nr:hypothetical protein [bacterium]MBU1073689.1 hypothetical protein [bacterium]MBU1675029.1 hypothetical protein [bacterium]